MYASALQLRKDDSIPGERRASLRLANPSQESKVSKCDLLIRGFVTRANICSIYGKCLLLVASGELEVNLSPIKGRWASGA